MGVFIIAAALLTKLYSLYPPLLTYAYLNWYCREASVCVYVTNLPAIWTLILDVFPGLRRMGRTTKNQSSSERTTQNRTTRGAGTKDYPLKQFGRLGSSAGTPGVQTESTEYIVDYVKSPNNGLHINRDVTFTVRRESASDDDDPEKQVNTANTRYLSDCSAV